MRSYLFIFIVLTFFLDNTVHAQSTFYYKLDKIVKKGVVNKNVSGGQFITFIDKCCYESDNKGFSVNHGKMEYSYTNDGIKIYSGDSYWGSSSLFLFTTDMSALNVKVNDEETFVYKKTSPPADVKTCSLIRKKDYEGSIYAPSVNPVFPNSQHVDYGVGGTATGQSGDSQLGKSKHDKREKVNRKCSTCNGKGTYERNDSGFGMAKYKKRCNVCGYEFWNNIHHWHASCPTCYGKGYVEYWL